MNDLKKAINELKIATHGRSLYDGIIVRSTDEFAAKCCLQTGRAPPPEGVRNLQFMGIRVTQSPMMPRDKAALTMRGEIVAIVPL